MSPDAPSSHDPRQLDPSRVEQDESDVARTQGSSTPEVDAEEAGQAREDGRGGDKLDTDAVLEAMPGGNAETQDQVTQREPDTEDHTADDPDPHE